MKRILITGGSGFIGASLIKRLAGKGVAVRIFDLSDNRSTVDAIAGQVPGLEWVHGNIVDGAAVSKALEGCDGVVHLAGLLTQQCANNPVLGAEVNLIGGLNVFNAARQQGLKRVVYASSAGVFGPDDLVNPAPITHYGTFKLALEGSARAYWHDAGISSIGLRPFIVYGPGREVGVSAGPSLACRAAAMGEAYNIPFSGTGGFVYVEDLIDVLEQSLETTLAGAHVFNLTGEVADVAHIAGMINNLHAGASIGVEGATLGIAAGVSEKGIEQLMPQRKTTSLQSGLQATIAFYSHVTGHSK